MTHNRFAALLLFIISILGCRPEPYSVEVGFNNGSTTGKHSVYQMTLTTASGSQANLSMGGISSYPGASSSGGRIGVPVHIQGRWDQGWDDDDKTSTMPHHRISADIPKNAEAKMKLMDDYYQNLKKDYGSMQVIVDGPRVRVFYTKKCFSKFDDCTPKKGIDPNSWVVKSPKNTTDVVILFDGIGESSESPFLDLDKNKD